MQRLTPDDNAIAERLQIEPEFVAFAAARKLPVPELTPFVDASPAELQALAHRRFFGALLLRELAAAAGDERQLQQVTTRFGADGGELQRFWESAERNLQLVRSMCQELNWTVLARLLKRLRDWFRCRVPRSFQCFVHLQDVPFACVLFLARKEWTVREIAERGKRALAETLIAGLSSSFGIITVPARRISENVVMQPRRRDYEQFRKRMWSVAERLHDAAVECLAEREMKRMEDQLESCDLSLLMSPLATEKEVMMNAFENEGESDGERSEGVLPVSDDTYSEVVSEEDDSIPPPASLYQAETQELEEASVKRMRCEYGGHVMTEGLLQQYVCNGVQVTFQGDYKSL